MDHSGPIELKTYQGIISDTRRWAEFEHRPSDILICIPPKSGTTWMQSICGFLIFGNPNPQIAIADISPWMEAQMRPFEEVAEMLASQSHQRFIKSHSPADAVPYQADCIYLIGHRHPLDVHFSMRAHISNAIPDSNNHLYPDDISAGFKMFVENGVTQGDGFDQPSLAFLAHHLKTFRAIEHLPNVHFFHYENMKRDLFATMHRVSDAIGTSHPPELFDQLVKAATFDAMKSNASKFAPGAGKAIWRDEAGFFNSGQARKWEGKLSDDEIARYNQKISELLSPDDIRWIETGQ